MSRPLDIALDIVAERVERAERHAREAYDAALAETIVTPGHSPTEPDPLLVEHYAREEREAQLAETYYTAHLVDDRPVLECSEDDGFSSLDDARTDLEEWAESLRDAGQPELIGTLCVVQGYREPCVVESLPAAEEYEHLGNHSVHETMGVSLSCDHCRVRWTGCAAAADCPRCGEGKEFWQLARREIV